MERRTTKETWEEYGQQNDDIIVDSFSGMYERRLVPRAQRYVIYPGITLFI